MTHMRLSNYRRSVVRSLGEDIWRCSHWQMVAKSRRQRMVAHNITDVSFLFVVMKRRRAFFQEDPSIVFLTVRVFVASNDKVEVESGFVGGNFGQSGGYQELHGECVVLTNFPASI